MISGIQSTGKPTIGNLLGAYTPHVKLQETNDTTFFIADLHSITVRQEPANLKEQIYSIAAWYLACGIDPNKSTLFAQSHVPAHSELGWILSTFTQMGELERMTQFKDKAQRNKQNINAGLFTYPTLMAADILIHKVDEVPVGHDQIQHMELTRDIATRFNGIYGDVFKVPEIVVPKVAARVKDLQSPTAKMSKSVESGGTIFMEDDLKQVEKKVKRAVTDDLATVNYDETNQPGVSNLLGIYAACEGVSIPEAVAQFEGQQYGNFKKAVAESLIAKLDPIQQRYNELMSDKAELDKILAHGADKAAVVANATLKEVQAAMGFVTRWF